MKVAVVSMIKNENRYLRQWVEHNKSIGVSNIILGDNNDADGENLSDVISDYIESGYVIVENYSGKRCYQLQFNNETYAKYIQKFDWLAYVDIDEYIMIGKYQSIIDFLSDPIYEKYDALKLQWECYGDSGLIRPNYDIPLVERFTEVAYTPMHMMVKPIIHNTAGPIEFINAHAFTYLEDMVKHTADVNCKEVDPALSHNYLNAYGKFDIDIYIKHYITKTIYEYIDKINRGDVRFEMTKKYTTKWVNDFFIYNRRTTEKEQILNDFLDKYLEKHNIA